MFCIFEGLREVKLDVLLFLENASGRVGCSTFRR